MKNFKEMTWDHRVFENGTFFDKKVHFKKHGDLMSFFFFIFHEKPAPVMPIFGQKTLILSKLHNIMGQKSL